MRGGRATRRGRRAVRAVAHARPRRCPRRRLGLGEYVAVVESTEGEFNKGKSRKKVSRRRGPPSLPLLAICVPPLTPSPPPRAPQMLAGKLKAKQSQHSAEELQRMQAELFAKARQKLYADA